MNEPRWADKDRTFASFSPFKSQLTLDEVNTFLKEGVKRISDHKLPSTVGQALTVDLKRYTTGDRPQFHFYPNVELLPTCASLTGASSEGPFVGEFSGETASLKSFIEKSFETPPWETPPPLVQLPHERPWLELKGKDADDAQTATFERLKVLHTKGYKLALLYPSNSGAVTGASKFSAAVALGLRAYNKWTPPP
jgi:hypothetical protein